MSAQVERIRIGQLLLSAGVLSEPELKLQLQVARTIGQPLGQILLESGLVTKYQLICAVQVQSMIVDRQLSLDDGIEVLRLVCADGYDLADACKKVGATQDKPWSCRLGELLVSAGIISTRQLLDAVASSFETSVPLGQTLVQSRRVRPDIIAAGLNLQKDVRNGSLTMEQAVEKLSSHQTYFKNATVSHPAPESSDVSLSDSMELTGDLEANTLDQIDEFLWSRIKRDKIETPEPDRTSKQAASELIGSVLANRYEVISVIGAGGMSFVYLVRSRADDKVLALKMMQPHLSKDPDMVQRFKQEAQTVSVLDHPNVVAVHDFGITEQGQFYLVMDYITGMSLSELVKTDGKLGIQRALPIALQACRAFAHAHSKGVIHRDIKPSNMMLSVGEHRTYTVSIVDFGIAKILPLEGSEDFELTKSGKLFGSPLYMSPERCMGQPLDGRSDIYSMGCVLYEMLTGHPPFSGTTSYEIFYKHMQQKPVALPKLVSDKDLQRAAQTLVSTCLAKDPDKRYQSMSDLTAALETLLAKIKPDTVKLSKVCSLTLLGDVLQQSGLLTREIIDERLRSSQSIGQPLGQTLLQFKDLNHAQLIAAVQVQSLLHDSVLTTEQAVTTLKIINDQQVCLEEALEQIGLLERDVWTNRLGELLTLSKNLSHKSLHKALFIALKEVRPLGHILVEQGMVKPLMVAKALSVQKRIREGLLSQDDGLVELRLDPKDETLFDLPAGAMYNPQS